MLLAGKRESRSISPKSSKLRPTNPRSQELQAVRVHDMGVGRIHEQDLEERTEERLSIAVIVQLAPVRGARTRALVEVGFTLNISPHGAYVVSSYPWEKGDLTDVTSLNDQTTLRGKVVHRQRRDNNRYGIGLNFAEQALNWSVFRKFPR